jgi:hypothetical protein
MIITCSIRINAMAPKRATKRKIPSKSGPLDIKIDKKTRRKYAPYLAGQASLFRLGLILVATAIAAYNRAAKAVGRYTPLFCTQTFTRAASSPYLPRQSSIHAWYTIFPRPGIELQAFHHPVLLIMAGAREYWKKRARATVAERSSADLFLPVVPAAVDPKQELQSEQTAFDAQYVTPKDI